MTPSTIQYFDSPADPVIHETLMAWGKEVPDSAVLALVAEADREAIPALQRASNDAQLPLLGGIFPELLDSKGFKRQGVLLLRLDQAPVYRIVEGLSAGVADNEALIASMAAVADSMGGDEDKGTLLLIFDAMVPTIESWLEALYRRIGRSVFYLGVNAGSETIQPMPCLFDNQRIVQDAVLVAALANLPGGVLEHGYQPPKKMITATATEGNRIISIDWRPALEVYSELTKQAYGVEITRENFSGYGVHFPFGVVRATGEVLVRIPVAIDDDNTLFCIGEIPENAILTLLRADDSDSQKTVDQLVQNLGGITSESVLVFYCAGRRMHDPRQATKELNLLAEQLPVPLAGALSLGEIGSSTRDGYPLFHNATLVCADWVK